LAFSAYSVITVLAISKRFMSILSATIAKYPFYNRMSKLPFYIVASCSMLNIKPIIVAGKAYCKKAL
jgi:hypothetical protein